MELGVWRQFVPCRRGGGGGGLLPQLTIRYVPRRPLKVLGGEYTFCLISLVKDIENLRTIKLKLFLISCETDSAAPCVDGHFAAFKV